MRVKIQNLRRNLEEGWSVVIRTDDAEAFLEWLYEFASYDIDTKVLTTYDSSNPLLEYAVTFQATDRIAALIKLSWK